MSRQQLIISITLGVVILAVIIGIAVLLITDNNTTSDSDPDNNSVEAENNNTTSDSDSDNNSVDADISQILIRNSSREIDLAYLRSQMAVAVANLAGRVPDFDAFHKSFRDEELHLLGKGFDGTASAVAVFNNVTAAGSIEPSSTPTNTDADHVINYITALPTGTDTHQFRENGLGIYVGFQCTTGASDDKTIDSNDLIPATGRLVAWVYLPEGDDTFVCVDDTI